MGNLFASSKEDPIPFTKTSSIILYNQCITGNIDKCFDNVYFTKKEMTDIIQSSHGNKILQTLLLSTKHYPETYHYDPIVKIIPYKYCTTIDPCIGPIGYIEQCPHVIWQVDSSIQYFILHKRFLITILFKEIYELRDVLPQILNPT